MRPPHERNVPVEEIPPTAAGEFLLVVPLEGRDPDRVRDPRRPAGAEAGREDLHHGRIDPVGLGVGPMLVVRRVGQRPGMGPALLERLGPDRRRDGDDRQAGLEGVYFLDSRPAAREARSCSNEGFDAALRACDFFRCSSLRFCASRLA